jgi:hypothetical protein
MAASSWFFNTYDIRTKAGNVFAGIEDTDSRKGFFHSLPSSDGSKIRSLPDI